MLGRNSILSRSSRRGDETPHRGLSYALLYISRLSLIRCLAVGDRCVRFSKGTALARRLNATDSISYFDRLVGETRRHVAVCLANERRHIPTFVPLLRPFPAKISCGDSIEIARRLRNQWRGRKSAGGFGSPLNAKIKNRRFF